MCSFGGWREAMIGNTSGFKGYLSGDICLLLFIQNISPFLAGFMPRLIFYNQLALTKFGRSADYHWCHLLWRQWLYIAIYNHWRHAKQQHVSLATFAWVQNSRKWWKRLVKEHEIAGFFLLKIIQRILQNIARWISTAFWGISAREKHPLMFWNCRKIGKYFKMGFTWRSGCC